MNPPSSSLLAYRFPYQRDQLKTGIVHIGVGNFHRSHQAWYLHRLLSLDPAQSAWAICGVGLLPGDRTMRDVLERQKGLFTLLEKKPAREYSVEVIGSMADYLFAPDDPWRVIERIAHPETRIVTLTITEGGYDSEPPVEPAALGLHLRQRTALSQAPVTAFGYLAAAFALRQQRGAGPMTVLSCDNIQANGAVCERACRRFAALGGPSLVEWVERNVSFPNCMVDRITPVTSDADCAVVRSQFGLDDLRPVPAEPFVQWVVEDHFAAGRPPLEKVGVQFVKDVAPYEKMKLRLLNCSHQALGYFGVLLGHQFVHEAALDPDIARLLRHYMDREATPTLDPVPGVDLENYKQTLIERFQNDSICDTLARICAYSSERISKWLVPVIQDELRLGGPIDRSAGVVASWARYLEALDVNGKPFNVVDRKRDEFVALADQRQNPPEAFLKHPLFEGLGGQPRFVASFVSARAQLDHDGPRALLRRWT